ncbi:MAG: glycosyltransferase family 4 protein [Myxococcales bacterium]|nr:glycosyltransferase family 4 protein [Myxococcales bacterium]
MRVTFVLPSADLSGGCKVVAIHARGLQDRGHDVEVVVPKYAELTRRGALREAWRRKDPSYLFSDERFRPLRENHLVHQNAPFRFTEHVGPVLARDVPDADVIIATWWETAEWIQPFPRSKGVKSYFVQGLETDYPFQPRDRVIATLRLPYRQITVSQWLVDKVQELAPGADIQLAMNGVEAGKFPFSRRPKNDRPTAGFMFSTAGFKGMDTLRDAVEHIRKAVPDVRLVSFGSAKPGPEAPLPERTDFRYSPPQAEIPGIYASCDVWILSSRSEGFGLPALEAMACGTPVVATRVGGPIDVIDDGVNGHLVNIEDPAALAQKTVEVLRAEPAAWEAMSFAARRSAERFTWSQGIDQFEAALTRAITPTRT